MESEGYLNLLVQKKPCDKGDWHAPEMIEVEGSRQKKKPGQVEEDTELSQFGIHASNQSESDQICGQKNKGYPVLFFHVVSARNQNGYFLNLNKLGVENNVARFEKSVFPTGQIFDDSYGDSFGKRTAEVGTH